MRFFHALTPFVDAVGVGGRVGAGVGVGFVCTKLYALLYLLVLALSHTGPLASFGLNSSCSDSFVLRPVSCAAFLHRPVRPIFTSRQVQRALKAQSSGFTLLASFACFPR